MPVRARSERPRPCGAPALFVVMALLGCGSSPDDPAPATRSQERRTIELRPVDAVDATLPAPRWQSDQRTRSEVRSEVTMDAPSGPATAAQTHRRRDYTLQALETRAGIPVRARLRYREAIRERTMGDAPAHRDVSIEPGVDYVLSWSAGGLEVSRSDGVVVDAKAREAIADDVADRGAPSPWSSLSGRTLHAGEQVGLGEGPTRALLHLPDGARLQEARVVYRGRDRERPRIAVFGVEARAVAPQGPMDVALEITGELGVSLDTGAAVFGHTATAMQLEQAGATRGHGHADARWTHDDATQG